MTEATIDWGARAAEAVAVLNARGIVGRYKLAIVLGTGLVRLAEEVEEAISVPYSEIPHFPQVGVSGHAGHLIAGKLSGLPVLLMQGRAHYYETGDGQAMRPALETLRALGVDTLVLTNAAGSLRLDWHPGSLAVISDHINFSGTNPLIGERGDRRFVNMVDAYDPRLRRRLKLVAQNAGLTINEGVYMWFSGPSFETPAEVRVAKMLGADLVGMSTVPETLIARLIGFDVMAISVITNHGAGILGASPTHGETKTVAVAGSIALRRLLAAFAKALDEA